MEQNQNNQPTPETEAEQEHVEAELVPIARIGVETELSRYPVHNLAKTGKVDIHITKKRTDGQVDLKWEVSFSDKYGQARQLAYKLDTILINRRIDEEGRPIPKVIRLGSLREIAETLDLGGNTNKVRRALRQNVGALISAKLRYRSSEGVERTLEADFTRYSAIFTGEKLPDGREADAVYLILNEPYREVLNNAPIRPLNYEYLKALPPAPQRFYEIISSRIYAALKNRRPLARILYSEFCTYSALTRHFDYENFRVQMAKIHKLHLKSGYIAKAHYEETTDQEGRADWMMCYQPGPRARTEYMTFARKSKQLEAKFEALEENQTREAVESEPAEAPALGALPKRKKPEPKDPLLIELTNRGIAESKGKKLLASLKEGQQVLDQLEWGDHLIQSQPGKIKNGPGYYIWLLTENVTPPATFETSRHRKERQEAGAAAEQERLRALEQEEAWEAYKSNQLEEYISTQVSEAELAEITARKRKHLAETFRGFRLMPQDTIKSMLWGAVKAEIRPRVKFSSFEEFLRQNAGQLSLFETGQGSEAATVETVLPSTMGAKTKKTALAATIAPGAELGAPPPAWTPYRADLSVSGAGRQTAAGGQSPAALKTTAQAAAEPEQGSEALGDEVTLQERYREFCRAEARRALDQLEMLERGRRMKAGRAYLLNEHPEREHYKHLIAEGEYDEFHRISEEHLIRVTLADLKLPNFEDWKRYALSAMARK